LSRLPETIRESRATHVVSLLTPPATVPTLPEIEAGRHLFIGMSDIAEATEGHVLPGREHVEALLAFVRAWDRERPLLIHCWAGISRSTAAAFIAACALEPKRSEPDVAAALRRASPMATPNRRLVAVADEILGREGRMVEAVAAIGRGADAFGGAPFSLALAGDP
jgi:predicted protein tyrosine phosphatase